MLGHSMISPKFGFDMGRGRLDLKDAGCVVYTFGDEEISGDKPWVAGKNIIMGEEHVDIDVKVTLLNHRTGEKAEIAFVPRSRSQKSSVKIKVLNAAGKPAFEITGSWLN
mmetsp:Transcript_15937/g.24638  ORF Transcript_15937/g.24638 Transcript_15937/m.24638 type:complete len:110 (-) Transcript_15937:462-791(-)